MSERYINNLTGDFSICFSEHLTEHPNYLLNRILLSKFAKNKKAYAKIHQPILGLGIYQH